MVQDLKKALHVAIYSVHYEVSILIKCTLREQLPMQQLPKGDLEQTDYQITVWLPASINKSIKGIRTRCRTE